MTKELIELAAKALGYEIVDSQAGFLVVEIEGNHWIWNPRTTQSDSDRMACDLEISLFFSHHAVSAYAFSVSGTRRVEHDGTIEGRRAAVRLARLQVAAQMGRVKL